MKNQSIISAALIAISIVVLGLCLKGGIDNYVNRNRMVEVKGLSEREVEANLVTWPISVKETGNNLQELYRIIDDKSKAVQKFLIDNGIKKDEIYVNAPTSRDYVTEGSYNQNSIYRYNISVSITVVSKNVKLVREIINKQGELLSEGIAINSGDGYYEQGATYEYTDFKKMKAEMVAEAIENAQVTAEQFADNSKSKINKIVTADQGYFEITDRDSNTPYIKNIRLVTHVTYSLKD
jgi:hypothetical protein